MYFLKTLIVRNLPLRNLPIEINLNKSNVKLIFREYKKNESGYQDKVYCDAIVEKKPNSKNLKILESIHNRIPLNLGKEFKSLTIITNSKGQDYTLPSLKYFPPHFIDFQNEVSSILFNAIDEVVNKIIWTTRIVGLHNPYNSAGISLRFSFDGKKYNQMPGGLSIEVLSSIGSIELNDSQIKLIADETLGEPLHYSLFREAWHQMSSNKRSALILGIAALESALKHLIVNLIPNSDAFIKLSVAPPVFVILSTILPTLPIKNRIENSQIEPSSSIIKSIKNWTHQRNLLVHHGGKISKSIDVKDAS